MKKIIVKKDELPIEIMSTMGCRTQNGADINAKESFERNVKSIINNGVLYDSFISAAQKDGRGNICPVTIIMPTLAMEALEKSRIYAEKDGNKLLSFDVDPVETFMNLLDQKIHEAKDMLIERFEYICSQSPESAKFMYENGTMLGYKPEEGIRSALKHGTLALG